MKKALKILLVLASIGAAVAGILIYLKNNGYLACCDCDDCCDCCDCCDEQASDDEDPFSNREYVSIQPKADDATSEEA